MTTTRAKEGALLVGEGARRSALWLRGRVALLGRSPDCDVVLEADGVSAQHAVVRRSGSRYVLYDLVTPAGVYVNGRRVERHVLADGDVVALGEATIHYLESTREVEVVAATPPGE